MASYTNVPDSVLEPGDPIRSVDIIAIKDNIEHYAENNGTTNVFTSPGTWTKPATVQRIKVTVVGGGGGGGRSAPGSSGGGGGGGASIRWIPAPSIPGPVSVTVGAGGSSAINSTGGTGGTSSFGAFLSATGGGGGANPGIGGGAGNGSSGDLNMRGSSGYSFADARGRGGSSIYGGETLSGIGALYGGGGGSASNPTVTNGASGFVIVEEFY
jgi:hypothetical protein